MPRGGSSEPGSHGYRQSVTRAGSRRLRVHRGVESAAKRFLLVLLRDDSRGTPGNSLRDAKNLGDSSSEKEEEKRWT